MFISAEGLDGAGTTTVVQEIGNRRPEYVTTAEPTDGQYGSSIRENLSNETDPIIDLFLFVADRRQHLRETIEPSLAEDKTVLTDRYTDSTRAYQPISLVEETDDSTFYSSLQAKNYIEWLHGYWHREPDLTLLIDVPVDIAIERSALEEKYENEQYLQEARDNYRALADFTERIVTIDGTQSVEDVVSDALAEIDSHDNE